MTVRTSLRLVVLAPAVCAATLLAACGSTAGGTPATSGGSQPASGSSAGSGSSSSNAKCTDLTPAAASAAVGKRVTLTLDTRGGTLAGHTTCDVTVADEVYPIQLDVMTNGGQQLYSADKQAMSGVDISGVGDQAFTSSTGVEALKGGVDIKVVGPAGPVLSGNFAIPTAIAKAMAATVQ
jgi:hypothetical protein